MGKRKNVRVTQQTGSGRNTRFYDPTSHRSMSRAEFVSAIERGAYPGYHVRQIGGVKTPVSNPDKSENNNLD